VHPRDRPAPGTKRSTGVDAFKLVSLTQREQFYSNVLRDLLESDLPFMIGGGYAVNLYTHARRPTKDLDIFTPAAEFPRLLSHLQRHNRVSADESWLGKVHRGRDFVDASLVPAMASCRFRKSGFSMPHRLKCSGIACL
jgi:hypothetical protein